MCWSYFCKTAFVGVGAIFAKQLLLELFAASAKAAVSILTKFFLLEIYMLSPYIILVSNSLVG